jgi:hypothetical protein
MTMVFARYRAGLVGETRRLCHVVELPAGDTVPDALSALCGEAFPPGVLEQLAAWHGMPCIACTVEFAKSLDSPAIAEQGGVPCSTPLGPR